MGHGSNKQSNLKPRLFLQLKVPTHEPGELGEYSPKTHTKHFHDCEIVGVNDAVAHSAIPGPPQVNTCFIIVLGIFTNQVKSWRNIDGATLMVVKGDLTRYPTDAIVNAACTSMWHCAGSGLATAIYRKGRPTCSEV